MDITPDFAELAEQWIEREHDHREGVSRMEPWALARHQRWGALLTDHGWLTETGARPETPGTIATPAEVIAVIRGDQ